MRTSAQYSVQCCTVALVLLQLPGTIAIRQDYVDSLRVLLKSSLVVDEKSSSVLEQRAAALTSMVCRSSFDIASAIYNQNIKLLYIMNSIVLEEADFASYVLPLHVLRDINISGSQADPENYPVLDLNFLRGKVP